MYKLFGSVKDFDYCNRSKQSDLVLKKYWVTQCGWLWLCMKVAMGIAITNFWKLFSYGVKRYNYERFIGIKEFLG